MAIKAHYQSFMVHEADCEVCLLDLKSIRIIKGRKGEGVVRGEVRVPTQMLSPPLRELVARRPEPPSQYGVRKM